MKDLDLKLFSNFPLPILLLEPKEGIWMIRNVSDKYCEATGSKRQELLNKNIESVFPESVEQQSEIWNIFFSSFQKVLKTAKPDKIPSVTLDILNAERGDNKERYWKVENHPMIADNDKGVEYVICTLIDRTAEEIEQNRRKILQEELGLKEQERRFLIEANPDGLYSLDVDGNFLSVNNGLSHLVDLPREVLLEKNFRELIAVYDLDRIVLIFQEVLKGNIREFEVDFFNPAGEKKILKISLMPLKMEDCIKGAYGIVKDVTGIKNTQEALEIKERELLKSKNKYRALVQEAFDLVGILDLDGNYKFVSESSTSVLGIPPEDFIGKNAFEFIHPDDREKVLSDFSEIEIQKKIKTAPFRFKDGEGNWKWVETNVTNLINDPNVEGLVTNSREITDLVCKNRELQELYERYELAAAATGDLIYDWDLVTDTVKRFFKGKEKQFGYDEEEMDQRHFWKEHVHPQELKDLEKILRNTLSNPDRTQIRTHYRFKRADGTFAHLIDRGMIVRDENGKALRVIGATSDISGLINRRNALRIANKRFTYAMKATQEMIWDWDIVNNSIDRGKAFKNNFGYDAKGHTCVDDFWFNCIVEGDRERIKDSLERTLDDSSLNKWRQEYRIKKPDGKKAYVVDRGFIIRDHSGNAVRMVGATLDVTKSRRMLKKIKKQNTILKEVAWEQAHVVRAPIARLQGLLNLFEDDYRGEWKEEEILQLIKDSINELDTIVVNIIRKTERIEING